MSSRSTVRVQVLWEYLSGQYLLNQITFLNEPWHVGASSSPGVSCKKCGFLSSGSSQGHSVGSNLPKNNPVKFWTFYNQAWYSDASSPARALCDNVWLLILILLKRSWSQWGLKSSGNIIICPPAGRRNLGGKSVWDIVMQPNPGLPPGGFLISASAVPHCGIIGDVMHPVHEETDVDR